MVFETLSFLKFRVQRSLVVHLHREQHDRTRQLVLFFAIEHYWSISKITMIQGIHCPLLHTLRARRLPTHCFNYIDCPMHHRRNGEQLTAPCSRWHVFFHSSNLVERKKANNCERQEITCKLAATPQNLASLHLVRYANKLLAMHNFLGVGRMACPYAACPSGIPASRKDSRIGSIRHDSAWGWPSRS
jgi:hypothetical protein